MIPNRPKINNRETAKILQHFFPVDLPLIVVVAVRGYFKNTFGQDEENDLNVWDDAMIVCEQGTMIKAFNANTDPSKVNANLAMLDTGIYRFYRGRHKNRIDAFRAYPEGVRLKCKRQDARGRWFDAYCSAINIHDGGANDTWSAGCQTLPNYKGNKQFDEFRDLVYRLMEKHVAKTLTYLLIDEKQMSQIINAPETEIEEPVILEIPSSSAAAPPAEIQPKPGEPESSDARHSEKLPPEQNAENNPSNQEPPPMQQAAENITNVNNAASTVPADFKPQDKTVDAPPPSGMMAKARNWFVALGLGVPSVSGLVQTIKSYFADGTLDWRETIQVVSEVGKFILPYAAFFAAIFIVIWGIKELVKQASVLMKIYVTGRADMNNVEVTPFAAQSSIIPKKESEKTDFRG